MLNITDTVSELKTKLKDAWLRGAAQRIEIGTLLLALRSKAKHGTWGDLLADVGIPASTAADYMTEASRQIHGIREFKASSRYRHGKVGNPRTKNAATSCYPISGWKNCVNTGPIIWPILWYFPPQWDGPRIRISCSMCSTP